MLVLAACTTQALLASGDGNLVYLEISEGDIHEKAHLKLDAEIACLDLSPLSTLLQSVPPSATCFCYGQQTRCMTHSMSPATTMCQSDRH
jgi:hypothetical protein